ncbi:MAG TPA: MBL fold metallo-hydrolase [Thermoanaerobaculia bacterium]|nr:MBL fold metallo-hydrolase [Thermoanaerobaculia bacterium]
MHLGDLELVSLVDGTFRLDGGAMFGVVPKVLWEKKAPADEKNRIQMTTNCLLVRTGALNVLVETGMGGKWSEKERGMYGIEETGLLPDRLRALGVPPEAIDLVLISHLHFDHAGGATTRREDGAVVPTFPNADYVIQKGELEHARAPYDRDRASYRPDDFEPVGRWKMVDGDVEIAPGIRCFRVKGHNETIQSFEIESDGVAAYYFADTLPMTPHVAIPWVMGYDLYPHELTQAKRRLLEKAVAEKRLCVFEHDPDIPWGVVVEDAPEKRRVVPIPVDAEVFRPDQVLAATSR